MGKTQGKTKRVALGISDSQLAAQFIQEMSRYQNFLLVSENPSQINTTSNHN